MKILVYSICGLLALCSLILLAITYIFQPGWDGVVASLRLEDGSEYMVTQQCNWDLDPYTVSFYMKLSGGKWGWCYIDHEADPWRNISMRYDRAADSVLIEEAGVLRGVLDRKGRSFEVPRLARGGVPAPQEIVDPPFPFPGK
jgi:hypothetical protein